MVQGEWNILRMGDPKYIGQCKMVRFKTIYIESMDTGVSIPLMTDGLINVSKISFAISNIRYYRNIFLFLEEHGHHGRLCQSKSGFLPVGFA